MGSKDNAAIADIAAIAERRTANRERQTVNAKRCTRSVLLPITYLLFCFGSSELSSGYILEGGKWQHSPVNIQTKLTSTAGSLVSPPTFPLYDGSTSWEQVYNAAVADWNAVIANLQLTTSVSVATNLGTEDGTNEAYFGTSVGGYHLDQNTLGLTVYYSDGTTIYETDTAFNSSYHWNSYRGPLLSDTMDFRRVAMHELGHVLGLADIPGTSPPAIMDLAISYIDTLTADDIAGVQALYGASAAAQAQSKSKQVCPSIDLNGDGHSDIVWFNRAQNQVAVWLMSGDTILAEVGLGNGPANAQIAGAADLMNLGRSQLIWYNGSNNYLAWSTTWSTNYTPLTAEVSFALPANYPVLAFADFDGDGLIDVVQWNPATGAILIAKNNGSLNFTTQWSGRVSTQWTLIGAADLNGDGQHELIWRNQSTGQVSAWVFSGFHPVQYPHFSSPPLAWRIRAIGKVDLTTAQGWSGRTPGLAKTRSGSSTPTARSRPQCSPPSTRVGKSPELRPLTGLMGIQRSSGQTQKQGRLLSVT